jgi:hypothetical protein
MATEQVGSRQFLCHAFLAGVEHLNFWCYGPNLSNVIGLDRIT